MNELPRQKLVELVARFGRDICEDARRCEALLRDVCGDQYKREVFVLVGAVKDRVASELAAGLNGVPKEVLLSRLSHRLHNNLGLAEDLARWSVETWALAFSIVKIEDITFQFACPACGHGAKIVPYLARTHIQCPKCKVAIPVSDDGRGFKLGEQSETDGHALSLVNLLFDEDNPFAEETSVTPEETLRQAIRRVLADGVVTEEEKADVQALRRSLCIAPEMARRFFSEEKARITKTVATGTVSMPKPVPGAVIHKVWIDENFELNGAVGMVIHAHFTAQNMIGLGGRVAAYLEFGNGYKVKSTSATFSTRGQVSVSDDIFPMRVEHEWRDFELFLPYVELHLDEDRTYELRLLVTVCRRDGMHQELAKSDYVTFTYGDAIDDSRIDPSYSTKHERCIVCPHCSRSFYTEATGKNDCPHCHEMFDIDGEGWLSLTGTSRPKEMIDLIDTVQGEGELTLAGASRLPTARFNGIWIDYDVTSDGRMGMLIRVHLTLVNMKAQNVWVGAYFESDNGQALKDANGQFGDIDGHVAVGTHFVPECNDEWKRLQWFMPYDELHLAAQQKHECRFLVQTLLEGAPAGAWSSVSCSAYQTFSVDAGIPAPTATINRI